MAPLLIFLEPGQPSEEADLGLSLTLSRVDAGSDEKCPFVLLAASIKV